MRSILCSLAIVAGVLCSSVAYAEESKPVAPAGERMDLEKVQKELAPIAKSFKVEVPKEVADEPVEEHKTVGDVADRALTMLQDVTAKLAGTLEKVAPKVWEIMVRQQYAKAISGPVTPLAVVIIAWLYMTAAVRLWTYREGSWWMEDKSGNMSWLGTEMAWRAVLVRFLPIGLMWIAALDFASELQQSIMLLANPEYYAIQDLLRSIMSGGQIS